MPGVKRDRNRKAVQFKLVLRQRNKPFSEDLDNEFNWILGSLGLLEPTSYRKTAASVFREIVKAHESSFTGEGITAVELVERLKMSRGSIMNHLNNLILSGLVVKEDRYYKPRNPSLFKTLRWIEQDINRIFREMEEMAKGIDEELGIKEKE